jgi:hypothetical protein
MCLTCVDGNCKLIYGLPFCSDVAYAVPANSSSNTSDLINFYDTNAQNLYQNFSISLQQVACNTTSTAQYSLARGCPDCQNDYKSWLCAVTIPRCDDFSSTNTNLMPRNVAQQAINQSSIDITTFGMQANDSQLPWFNQSRNPLIDQQIQPGPYKELLPCIDLCYEIVKSCPSVMSFACPKQEFLYNKSYSIYDGTSVSPPSCNFLGRDPPQMNSAVRRVVPWIGIFISLGVLHGLLVWS